MRGIRGAITVEENTAEAVMSATQEVVKAMLEANDIRTEDIGAAIFTATEDITAVFPAKGARALPGFELVPLFDARQMDVDGALDHCIRVLLRSIYFNFHWECVILSENILHWVDVVLSHVT